jgi:hypothetical protein
LIGVIFPKEAVTIEGQLATYGILPVSAVDFDFDALFSARTWW